MHITNKKAIWTFLVLWTLMAMFFFFILGRAVYEPFYRLTLWLVSKFSNDKLHFFGNFPFWFTGDIVFGIISGTIPLSFLLCYSVLATKDKGAFRWTFPVYSITLA